MKKVMKQFKINTVPKLTDAIEILFDFVVVALVSLLFNGFIINNKSSVFDQKFLMVANALLLSTHWYAYNFFRQRYEKKNSFFRIFALLSVLSFAIMALGIDLMVFRENSSGDPEAYNYLRWIAPILLVSGYLASRALISFKFAMSVFANRENKALVKLTIWKSISRAFISLLAIVHIILLSLGYSVALTTYVFFPIYFVIEFAGNVANVKEKYLSKAPKVSLDYVKDRYSKLNLLYISSFFISGTIQFAFYFKTSGDVYMIGRLIMVYLVAFMIWWAYMDRMHRFSIKQTTGNLMLIAIVNKFLVGALAVIGGLMINANTDKYLGIIIPSVFLAMAIFLAAMLINVFTFPIDKKDDCINPKAIRAYAFQSIPVIITFIVMGLLSIYFSFSVWVMYGLIIGLFLFLNIGSRYVIKHYIRGPEKTI